jgi:hypothetical protein
MPQAINGQKQCSKCKEVLPITLFGKETRSKDGLRSNCVMCRKLYRQTHYRNNPEIEREHSQRFRESHREYYDHYRQNKRLKALKHISSELKCVRCGITDVRVLQIDHINGGGSKERRNRRNRSGTLHYNVILKLTEDEARAKYQILCANCNWIKRFEQHEVNQYGSC